MWKYGQEGFFPLTYVEPKHQSNSHNQLVQVIFNADLDMLSMSAISSVV